MNVFIRKVKPGDEKILAYIQTESWKAAFNEIVPSEVLKECTEFSRAENMYARLLNEHIAHGYILEIDGQAHCIVYWDISRENNMTGYAELICIHSLQARWNQGYGSLVMEKVLDDIQKAGFTKIMLWVFEKNVRARKFYEKYGFVANGKKQEAFGAIEIMYEKEF